jgi:hypothetical protein
VTGVPLFTAGPDGTCRLVLRRFRYSHDRHTGHRHDASAVIDENAPETPRRPDGTKPTASARIPRDDPRWPARCGCGEAFADGDE